MKTIDMTSEAVMRRLVRASELRDLCMALMKAKKQQNLGGCSEDKNRHKITDSHEGSVPARAI